MVSGGVVDATFDEATGEMVLTIPDQGILAAVMARIPPKDKR